MKYLVLNLNKKTKTLKIARNELLQSQCSLQLVMTTVDPHLFEYASSYVNLTLPGVNIRRKFHVVKIDRFKFRRRWQVAIIAAPCILVCKEVVNHLQIWVGGLG